MSKQQRKTTSVGELSKAMAMLAPPAMAQSWDNVGLIAGDPAAPCRRLLLCIDLTPPVLEEVIAAKCDAVIAYHPPIFRPIKRLAADSTETDAIIWRAIRAGIAVYSPHTALDAAPGGANDVLAELCGLREVEPFEYVTSSSGQHKIVTFVPREHVERVCIAMAAAGAGRIGDYELCSYRLEGQGTFFGTASTHPAVGHKGRLEKVAETRLEMIAPQRRLPEIIDALLRAHPYEEPAYDVYPLTGVPSFGIGRVGTLPKGTKLGPLAEQFAKATGSAVTSVVGKRTAPVRRAAVCVGAAGLLPLEKARSADCDVIVTGEMRHHDALTLLRRGIAGVLLGHWESERPALASLARRLRQLLPGIDTRVSRKDTSPFTRIG